MNMEHHRETSLSNEELKASLERTMQRSRKSVNDRIARQRISPDEEAAARAADRALELIEPGAAIWVQSGKSRVLHVPRPVKRISIGDPDLAGIVILGPRTIMINGKEPKVHASAQAPPVSNVSGVVATTLTPVPTVSETTLVIWDDDGAYDTHTLFVADFIDEQVMLEVTVAELRRTALENHGIDVRVFQQNFISAYFMGGGGTPGGGVRNTVPPQIAQPLLPLSLTGDAPTYAFILPDENITAFIQALQTEGLATILAQPKIMAMSGQNAVFQVGGEIPIRISSGFATDIVFKPFGTLVNFVPRVSDDGEILLTVSPEVSRPDFSNTVEGIPSFLTRRAATSARLRNGQTLVIGGLLQKDRAEEVRGVPYLMNIPGLGYVFRNTTYTEEVTELMVIVTPHLIRPVSPNGRDALPTDRGPLTNDDVNTQASPAEATRPRIPGAP
jgi:pilus assembly protein CpaC